jgi:hypothetical protein
VSEDDAVRVDIVVPDVVGCGRFDEGGASDTVELLVARLDVRRRKQICKYGKQG